MGTVTHILETFILILARLTEEILLVFWNRIDRTYGAEMTMRTIDTI